MSHAVKVELARASRIDRRLAELAAEQAELLAERSRIFDRLADGTIDIVKGRRAAASPEPALPPISELDAVRARQALQSNARRRRVRA